MIRKSEILKKRLLSQIQNGIFPLGAAIPSRNQLCQKFQMSRLTVEQAVRELIQEGYLSAQRGSRTVVRSLSPVQEISRIFIPYVQTHSAETAVRSFFLSSPELRDHYQVQAFPEGEAEKYFPSVLQPGSAVIWFYASFSSLYWIHELKKAGVPQMLVNRDYEDISCVCTNHLISIRDGLAWLMIEAGRDIHLVTYEYSTERPYLADRLTAFYEAAIDLGARIIYHKIPPAASRQLPDAMASLAREFSREDRPVKAIFCMDLQFVLPLISAGFTLDKKPERDYYLLTFDYHESISGYAGIAMLKQQLEQLCKEAILWITSGDAIRKTPVRKFFKAELMVPKQ